MVRVSGTDLTWDIPTKRCLQSCLLSSWRLHISTPLWETLFTAWVKPKLSSVLPAGAGTGALGHRSGRILNQTQVALCTSQSSLQTSVIWLPSSLERLLQSLKFISSPGKMCQSWNPKLFPLWYSTRCPLSYGFAWKQYQWEATLCFTPFFHKWYIYICTIF